jgi:riboflavin kinase/FMN adenylyltransferase
LSRELKVSQVVIGKNFRFGKGRQGCPELLREEGHRLGFQVTVIPPVRIGDEEISSSRIRQLLLEGDVRKAATLLNRDYEVVGEAISGDGRGRLMGFPTANLKVFNELIPRAGVYAVWGVFEGKRYPAMMNLGQRPTFPGSGPALEVHLIDFAGDLYGRSLSIHFVERIREERTFSGIEDLKRQLALDRSEALQILGPAHAVMESTRPGNLFCPANVNKGGNSH